MEAEPDKNALACMEESAACVLRLTFDISDDGNASHLGSVRRDLLSAIETCSAVCETTVALNWVWWRRAADGREG